VRRRDRRTAVEGANAQATQGAAMAVRGYDGSTKPLVANRGTVLFLDGQRLLDPGIFGMFQ
jgi:hypothetical protein